MKVVRTVWRKIISYDQKEQILTKHIDKLAWCRISSMRLIDLSFFWTIEFASFSLYLFKHSSVLNAVIISWTLVYYEARKYVTETISTTFIVDLDLNNIFLKRSRRGGQARPLWSRPCYYIFCPLFQFLFRRQFHIYSIRKSWRRW